MDRKIWIIYALCAAVTWGLSYSLDEKVLENKISPFILLFFQNMVAFFVYIVLVLSTKLKIELLELSLINNFKNKNFWLLIASTISVLVANIFICLSIQAKNATIASIVELAYPIFTVLFTYFLFKQIHLNLSILMGGLLIILGMIVIFIQN